jgi:limonene-1,2-epoxide hydrolase
LGWCGPIHRWHDPQTPKAAHRYTRLPPRSTKKESRGCSIMARTRTRSARGGIGRCTTRWRATTRSSCSRRCSTTAPIRRFFAALARADRRAALAHLAARPGLVGSEPGIVATLAGAGNTAAVALALDLGFPLAADALAVAVWRERTDTVRVLLDRGAPVTASVRELAERALTEHSEWTPHRSREIADALRASA